MFDFLFDKNLNFLEVVLPVIFFFKYDSDQRVTITTTPVKIWF